MIDEFPITDLVMRLRTDAEFERYLANGDDTEESSVMDEAANTIEALRRDVNIPRWIPVTERLPEAESGDTSKPVLVTDGDCMAIVEWFNFKLCEPYWSYTGIGDITHWMPLPEPPKESESC